MSDQVVRQSAVNLAQEVLQLLDQRKIEANTFEFVEFYGGKEEEEEERARGTVADFQAGVGTTCSTCACGSLFVAYMIKAAPPTTASRRLGGIGWPGIVEVLSEWAGIFTYQELRDIEIAFSLGRGYHHRSAEFTAEDHRVADLYKGEGNPTRRLTMIMQNIIDHEGTFLP